jgi:CheY-like chemotaxis protein
MGRMLRGMGHEVAVAANGFEALEALERERFDLVVMDVMMPGLDGVAATRRLRAGGHGRADIPVIGCSAHVSPEAEARYREIGMTAFLPKPVDRARLAAAIAEAEAAPGAG